MSETVITMTPSAARRIADLTGPGAVLRIGLKTGGCAGMEYTMEVTPAPGPDDIVVEQGDARVALAPMSQMFLLGTRIDYRSSLLEAGFHFENPNVSSACGCGESVSFSVEELAERGGT